MQNPYTTFATSRFVNRTTVIDLLRQCAQQLQREQPVILSMYLFGSFANGTATPRSDADILVEISDTASALRDEVHDKALICQCL